MHASAHGWFCFTAQNATDRIATDLHGPFPTRDAVILWLTQSGLQYRPNAEAYEQGTRPEGAPEVRRVGVSYHNEMTDGTSEGAWATAIHER